MEKENWETGNRWTRIQKADPETWINQFGTSKRYWDPENKPSESWEPKWGEIGFGGNSGSVVEQGHFDRIKRKVNKRKRLIAVTKPANDQLTDGLNGWANEFSEWGAAETERNLKEIWKLDSDSCWKRYCYTVVEWVA